MSSNCRSLRVRASSISIALLAVLACLLSTVASGGQERLAAEANPEVISEAAGKVQGAPLAKLDLVPAHAALLNTAADRKGCSAALANVGASQTIGKDGVLTPLACAPPSGSSAPDPCVAQLNEAFRAGRSGQSARGESLWAEVRSSSHCSATLAEIGNITVDRYSSLLQTSTTKDRYRDQTKGDTNLDRHRQMEHARKEREAQDQAQRIVQTGQADQWAAAQQRAKTPPKPEPSSSGRSGFQDFMEAMGVMLSVGVQLQDLKPGRSAVTAGPSLVLPRPPAEYRGPPVPSGSPARDCKGPVVNGVVSACATQ